VASDDAGKGYAGCGKGLIFNPIKEYIPPGLKPVLYFEAFAAVRAEETAEKGRIWGEIGGNALPWLKPALILLALCGG
jgi:hypothetical protein